MHPLLLRDTRVLDSGRIDTYGTVRILSQSAFATPQDYQESLRLYADELHRYAGGTHFARACDRRMEIVDRRLNRVSVTVPVDDIYIVEYCVKARVITSGYLVDEKPRPGFDYEEALNRAAAGSEPPQWDFTPFAKVDPKFAGELLTLLWLGRFTNREAVVFTKDSVPVPCSVDKPLAFVLGGRNLFGQQWF